jgi:hypothetical protein
MNTEIQAGPTSAENSVSHGAAVAAASSPNGTATKDGSSSNIHSDPVGCVAKTVSWRVALARMELNAVITGIPQREVESRSDACIDLLANNGYAVSRNIDPEFLSRLSLAASATGFVKVPGLILLDTSLAAQAAIKGLLQGCAESLQPQRTPNESTVGARPTPVPETPGPAEATSKPGEGQQTELGKGATAAPSLTIPYAVLIAEHQKRRREVEKKTVQNEVSALRRFLGQVGESETGDCRWMADQAQFEKRLDEAHVEDRAFRSALNKVRVTVYSLVDQANPANTLWESYLRAYYKHVNLGGSTELMSKNEFILFCFNATGISRKRLNAQTILVHGPTFQRVSDLEKSLGAEGELTRWLINMSDNNAETFKTAYGKRVSEAVHFNYAFPFEEWPDELKKEWSALFLFRTSPLKASRKWGLHLENVKKKKLFTWRIRKSDGACPSADNRRQELEWFFGWCQRPTELLPDGTKNVWRSGPDRKITPEQLSLALVLDQDLFDGYLEFRKAHTLNERESVAGEIGEFNRSCNNFIEFTSSLVNPYTGFIYLRKDLYFQPGNKNCSPRNLAAQVGFEFFNSEIGKAVHIDDPDERWLYFCKGVRSYMELTKANEFDPSTVTRGREPIASILALDRPMDPVFELLAKLEAAEPAIAFWKHFHHKKLLFFKLLSVCPLRVFQFALMTGTHLRKAAASSGRGSFYRIHFDKNEFKNERFIREQDYQFEVPEDFTTFIDHYLSVDWPAINGRPFTPDDRVFSGRTTSKMKNGVLPTRKQVIERITRQLMKLCRVTTARHLGMKYRTPGFGPHAMRHIKATDVIKRTGSYEKAALLLWDSIITVMKAYSHVKRVEQLAQTSREDYAHMKASMTPGQ